MNLRMFSDPLSWYLAIRERFIEAASAFRASRGAGTAGSGMASGLDLCLAGGSTPLPVYAELASDPLLESAFRGIPLRLWLGDERQVPADDPDRNGKAIERAFSGCRWTPSPEIRLWPDSVSSWIACRAYESSLYALCGPKPAFDLVLLGLGADGHTASLFSGEPALEERRSLAMPSRSPRAPFDRMTLTPAILGASPNRIFIARGKDKARIIERLRVRDAELPASRLAEAAEILYCEAD